MLGERKGNLSFQVWNCCLNDIWMNGIKNISSQIFSKAICKLAVNKFLKPKIIFIWHQIMIFTTFNVVFPPVFHVMAELMMQGLPGKKLVVWFCRKHKPILLRLHEKHTEKEEKTQHYYGESRPFFRYKIDAEDHCWHVLLCIHNTNLTIHKILL